jgi:hypothetical protein
MELFIMQLSEKLSLYKPKNKQAYEQWSVHAQSAFSLIGEWVPTVLVQKTGYFPEPSWMYEW